jgi:hypothetical protein
MEDKQIRLGDLLNIDGFDPMDIDVSYIQGTSHMIPRDGSIDLNEAERLATVFLCCADYCGELISQAVRLAGVRDADKKSKKGDAIERKISGKTPATTARETYGNDPEYVKSAESHTDAEAFLTWIKLKYENLVKAHVLCKDLLKSHTESRNVASWDGVEEDFNTKKSIEKSKKVDDKNNLSDIPIEDDFLDIG